MTNFAVFNSNSLFGTQNYSTGPWQAALNQEKIFCILGQRQKVVVRVHWTHFTCPQAQQGSAHERRLSDFQIWSYKRYISNVRAPREHARKINRILKSLKQKSWSLKIPGAEVLAALTEPKGQGPGKHESAAETIDGMGEKHPMEDPESVGQLLRNATENAPRQKRCCFRR